MKFIISDRNDLDNGPWMITLKDNIYNAFMKYSSNQQMRKLLFENYNSRASFTSETMLNSNSENIKNIINYRY